MLLASYDIVFQEVPGEVTLALNLSGCPNACPGCHSPHLRENTGEELDETLLGGVLERYANSVTCVCFMGGDADPCEVARLAAFVRRETGLKTAWYSGKSQLPGNSCLPLTGGEGTPPLKGGEFPVRIFDYIKLGPYIETLGGLDSPATNQRFYRVEGGQLVDTTAVFRK